MQKERKLIISGVVALLAVPAAAQQQTVTLSSCAVLADSTERLACFDKLAAEAGVPNAAQPAVPVPKQAQTDAQGRSQATENPPAPATAQTPATAPGSALPAGAAGVKAPPEPPHIAGMPGPRPFSLASEWELDPEHKRGVFAFRQHRDNYLIGTRTHRPNDAPYQPFRDLTRTGEMGLSHFELVFQIGFKMKLIENAFDKPLDLWFGYTQNSFWQANNQEASSPFRETNYQPEVMLVTPLDFNVLGMRARFLNLGLVHQSNGQTSTLSRSWNRLYAQVGLERGGFTLVGRVWKRLNESAEDDDNPDITDYMGRGDLVTTYRQANGSEYSAGLRYNFDTSKGAVQLGYAWPLAGNLKGYAHVFAGYGQSLIDYNYFHRTIGLGLLGTF